MAVFHYYVSCEPITPSIAIQRLVEVFAGDRADAIEKIKREGNFPSDWETVWVHLLVWENGDNRGFESTQIR